MKRKISTLKKEIAETRLELENREEEKSMTKDGSLSLPSENNGALAIANESHGALSLANKENA